MPDTHASNKPKKADWVKAAVTHGEAHDKAIYLLLSSLIGVQTEPERLAAFVNAFCALTQNMVKNGDTVETLAKGLTAMASEVPLIVSSIKYGVN